MRELFSGEKLRPTAQELFERLRRALPSMSEACGAIIDIPAETMAPKASTVKRLHKQALGFNVGAIERIYRGVCASCTKQNQKTKK